MSSEVRRDDGGAIDEVLAQNVGFHLEQMSEGSWWIGLTHADGTIEHLTLNTMRGAKITAKLEGDF